MLPSPSLPLLSYCITSSITFFEKRRRPFEDPPVPRKGGQQKNAWRPGERTGGLGVPSGSLVVVHSPYSEPLLESSLCYVWYDHLLRCTHLSNDIRPTCT